MKENSSSYLARWVLPMWVMLVASTLIVIPKTAEAVPSFARQTGQPCAACHTQAPRLNQFGREFKISGYRMSAQPIIAGANILETMPIGGRLRGDINYNTEANETRPTVADASRLYVSGRLTDNIGLHVNVGDSSGADAQVTIANEFNDWTAGFTGGNIGFGRADPYDTIGRGGAFQLQRNLVTEYDRQDLRGGALRNRGTGGMGYVHGNNLYFGVGAYDTSGEEGELRDFGVRMAYETPFADSHIGLFWFQADEHEQRRGPGTDKGSRYGIDASAQWELGENWLADIMGAYVFGKQEVRGDTDAPAALGENYDVGHRGWYIAAAFHRGAWSYGATFGQYDYRDDYSDRGSLVESPRVTSFNPNVSWLFAPNARLGFDVEVLDDEINDFNDTVVRIRYDIGF